MRGYILGLCWDNEKTGIIWVLQGLYRDYRVRIGLNVHVVEPPTICPLQMGSWPFRPVGCFGGLGV